MKVAWIGIVLAIVGTIVGAVLVVTSNNYNSEFFSLWIPFAALPIGIGGALVVMETVNSSS